MKKSIVMFATIIYVLACLCGCSNSKEVMIQNIKDCASEYGLENVDVRLDDYDYHEVFLYCSNFTSLDWDLIFEMDKKMNTINGVNGVAYIQGKQNEGQPFYVRQDENKILSYNKTDNIEYCGGWDDKSSENRQESFDEHKNAVDQEKDRLISTKKCGVCDKQATKRIDDEYYCDEHYEDAIEWYIEKKLDDDNK